MNFDEDIILVAGPTASGKTALAIELAQANDGIIINTDSMQVYSELRILSARPTAQQEALCPHFLFGHVPARQTYSVARWLDDVTPLIEKFRQEGRQIIFAGGTGLYFTTLLEGLSPMPEIKPEIRSKWRGWGKQSLHGELARLDPAAAKILETGDTQRVTRALEVFESTGVSITQWQQNKGQKILPDGASLKKLLLLPERPILHQRIDDRFEQMVEAGAVEEVRGLLELDLSSSLPSLKAIGVPQITQYLAGDLSLEEATIRSKAATRQYCKRQTTWFRNTFDADWLVI